MAFYDLSKEKRDELQRKLRHREGIEEMGVKMPRELWLSELMKTYSLTSADMKAILKGMKNG